MTIPTRILSCIALLILSTEVQAAKDIADILENLRELIDPLFLLLNAFAFMMGVGLTFRGLGMLKALGAAITQASKPGEVLGPLIYIIVGGILCYMPVTANIASYTIFGTNSDLVILDDQEGTFEGKVQKGSTLVSDLGEVDVEDQWADILDTLVLYINFIGYFSFIRGWLIISHTGQPGGQPGTIQKGLVHIFGGILAVNFIPLLRVLNDTILK